MIAAVPGWGGSGVLRRLDDDGARAGPDDAAADLAAAVERAERAHRPRWLWPVTAEVYPALLRAGVRVARCHDLALTEALLLGCAGRWGEPHGLSAAWARARGLPPPPDDPPARPRDAQPVLFDSPRPPLPGAVDPLDAVTELYADQRRRIAAAEYPERLRLLVAAESAGALAGAELGHDGLPWSVARHDAVLTELLGPRPVAGQPPARLAALAAEVSAAFGGARVNPDAPADVVRAFRAAGITVPSARSWVLRRVDHPAVAPLLAYKELSRLHTAHGWAWREVWVSDGRFRPDYVPGGVVSGRWATRGGGALQLPRPVRRAVVADPGWVLVVADAAQLEPRVLAALAGDGRLAAAASAGDLYAALAADGFGGDRRAAKVALLGAIYGQTTGEGGRLQPTLRRRFPDALDYVERAARDGEQGLLVRSRLGRTCPPPGASWYGGPDPGSVDEDPTGGGGGRAFERQPGAAVAGGVPAGTRGEVIGDGTAAGETGAGDAAHRRHDAAARARGRFTRNFVVQASAADWALVLLAEVRRRLSTDLDTDGADRADRADRVDGTARAELVFFQHDELVVHCPRAEADAVVAALAAAGEDTRRLVFGETPVRFPLDVSVVECYADAK